MEDKHTRDEMCKISTDILATPTTTSPPNSAQKCYLLGNSHLPPPLFDFAPRMHPVLEKMLESKLFEWDASTLRHFLQLTGSTTNDEELLLLNSFVNSQSELERIPGPGILNKDHISTRLNWIDSSTHSENLKSFSSPNSHKKNQTQTQLRRRTSSGTMLGSNSVGTAAASVLERPPNTNYSSLELDTGWVDRDRKIKVNLNSDKKKTPPQINFKKRRAYAQATGC